MFVLITNIALDKLPSKFYKVKKNRVNVQKSFIIFNSNMKGKMVNTNSFL